MRQKQVKYLFSKKETNSKRDIFNTMVASPVFVKELSSFRKKWNIKIPLIQKTKQQSDKIDELSQEKDFQKDLRDLRNRKLKLTEEWDFFLIYYIFHNHVNESLIQFIEKPYFLTKNKMNFIRIYPSTTQKDLIEVFNNYKKEIQQNVKRKRIRKRVSFQRDKKIHEYMSQSLKPEDVANKIDDEFGGYITVTNVKRIYSEFLRRKSER